MTETESGLSRWSKRKREAGQAQSPSRPTSAGGNNQAQISVAEQSLANSSATAPKPFPAESSDLPNDVTIASESVSDSPAIVDSELETTVPGTRVESLPDSDQVEEYVLTDDDMPAINSITRDSDISCFFNKGVSNLLRQKALKHLFGLPAFNIRDGLNDYDEDYTYFEPLGDTITSDMKFHAARRAKLEEEKRLSAVDEANTHSEDNASLSNDDENVPDPEPENQEPENRESEDHEPEGTGQTSPSEKSTEVVVAGTEPAPAENQTADFAAENDVQTSTTVTHARLNRSTSSSAPSTDDATSIETSDEIESANREQSANQEPEAT